MKKITFLYAILFLLFATGCSSAKKHLCISPSYESRMPEIKNIAVMADLALMRDMKESPYGLEESQVISKYATQAACTYLEKKGYSTWIIPVAWTGGFLDPEQNYNVLRGSEDEFESSMPPFFTAEFNPDKNTNSLQVTKLMRQVQRCVEGNVIPPHLKYEKLSGKRNYIEGIQEIQSADAVLVIFGFGKTVSGLKTFAQGTGNFIIGMATGLATGIVIMPTEVDKSYLNTYVALIDTRTNELLWSNYRYVDGDNYQKKKFYTKSWNKKLLYYLKKQT